MCPNNTEEIELLNQQIKMLDEENKRLRLAGTNLSIAALRVVTEYDGLHRLSLAVADWSKALADEHGRGKNELP